jgi:hypothetical protein
MMKEMELSDATKRLTPDDFKLPLIEEAYRLMHSAVANSSRSRLDERTSLWLSSDFFPGVAYKSNRRKELLGIPVRLTYDDDDDVPMIQLVMEPTARPR